MSLSCIQYRPIVSDDHERVRETVCQFWASPVLVSRGRIHQADDCPGFVCMMNNKLAGLILYRIQDEEMEIVALASLKQNQGIGTRLIMEVLSVAAVSGCRRIRVNTTNDNHRAIRFYQNRGFSICAVHRGAMKQARLLKPEIPLLGIDRIPIEDEIEFELKRDQFDSGMPSKQEST